MRGSVFSIPSDTTIKVPGSASPSRSTFRPVSIPEKPRKYYVSHCKEDHGKNIRFSICYLIIHPQRTTMGLLSNEGHIVPNTHSYSDQRKVSK